MNRRLATLTLAIMAGAMLAGCYQSPGVTVHKPASTRVNGIRYWRCSVRHSNRKHCVSASPWGRPTGETGATMHGTAIMSSHWRIVGLAVACLAAVACSPVSEPWVQGDEQLKQERARSAESFTELRERLAYTQNDR